MDSKLKDALDASQKEISLPNVGLALKVYDLKSKAEQYLTEKTKLAMEKKENSIDIFKVDAGGLTSIHAKCLCIGKQVELSQLEDGVKFVAEKLNALGEMDKIQSILTHIIKVDLYQSTINQTQRAVVLCYVHVDLDTYNQAMADTESSGVFIEVVS